MPANGSARTSRLVSVVALTGFSAHAATLTPTTKAIVPSQTSRFDHRCDTKTSPAVSYVVASPLTVIFGRRVDVEDDRRLRVARRVLVAVEGARLDRVDTHELAVLHLHPDETRAAD